MSEYKSRAEQLSDSLHLTLPPIAVALLPDAPQGIPPYEGTAPAGCAFWEQAAARTFSTVAGDHEMCAIGVHTHGLSGVSEAQPGELKIALEAMSGLDYVRDEEVGAIPVIEREVKCAVYGPLADFPLQPDVILLFGHSRQGLILSEAAARVDGGAPPAMGRPACAVVPQVINHGNAAMSLGCCGARAYLETMTDSVALWALPAGKLDRYCEAIAVLARANNTLTRFHLGRMADAASGRRPSIAESLKRLG